MIEVTTRLIDKSGEWYEDTVQIPADRANAQGVGSAITYAKRYALSAMLGIVTDEDTDGNMPQTPSNKSGSSNTTSTAQQQQPRPTTSNAVRF